MATRKTAEDIYQTIKSSNPEKVIIENCEIGNRLEFFPIHEIGDKSILFSGVIFENEFLVNGVHNLKQLVFENCTFHNNVEFIYIKSISEIPAHTNVIEFRSNCDFKKGLYFNTNSSLKGGINISNCQIAKLGIRQVNIDFGEFIITACKIHHVVEFGQNSFNQRGRFLKNTIECDIFSTTNFFREIEFIENHINGYVFLNSKKGDKISFIENTHIDKLTVVCESSQECPNLVLQRNVILNQASLVFRNIIGNHSVTRPFSLILNSNQASRYISIYSVNDIPVFSKIALVFTNESKGEIRISGLAVDMMEISGYSNSNCNTVINDISIGSLHISKFSNKGTLQFFNCTLISETKNTLKLLDSVLGDTQFKNTNINKFDSLDISNTDLSTISISPVPYKPISADKIAPQTGNQKIKHRIRNLYLEQNEDDEDVNSLRQERDVFRQLKLVCEKAGDRTGALYYKSYEMRTLHRELIRTKRFFNANRLLLALSRTNSYGQNYWWPIFWAIVFTTFFYIIIFTGISPQLEFKFTLNPTALRESASVLWDNFPLMFKMLNPVYDLTRFPGIDISKINPWVWFFEYVHKLTLAFFIFQTISAFRKFVK